MKQARVFCSLFILVSIFCLTTPKDIDAFDINNTVTNDGDLSVDMSIGAASSPDDGMSRLDRYRFELDGRNGTASVSNVYVPETGQTQAGIGYNANAGNPALFGGVFGGKLSADEEIGVSSCTSEAYCAGAASSAFDVEELTSESTGSFNESTYAINASGQTSALGGSFGIGVAEEIVTPDPSVYERNIYELKGEGVFTIAGEYGFGCSDVSAADPDPFGEIGAGGGFNEHGDIGIGGLCGGPSTGGG
jgi:hypothetical protein